MELFEISKEDILIPKKFVHSELNPYLWDKKDGEYVLKPEVEEKLKEISDYFFEFLEIETKYEDIHFLGSMASYNWTSKSDIDLHLIFDYSKINNNIDIVKMFMDMKKNYWNTQHDIKIFNYQVELYCQDINEKNAAKAIYSIDNNKWIEKPDLEKFKVDKEVLRKKIANLVNAIEDIEKLKDNQKIIENTVKIKERIRKMRKSGLEKFGEFSIENLVFKYLRNNGYLEKLNEIKRKAVDKKLSLNESVKNNKLTNSCKCTLIIKNGVDNFDSTKKELTKEFIKFVASELQLSEGCDIYFSADRNEHLETTASYNPNNHNIWIYVKNRNMLGDVLRSLAHEMMHLKQNLKKELHSKSGEDGSDHENEANSFSGKMIRKFGKLHPEIYH